ncbi:MAG: bifunctional transaldolase/phosoglucose isomerase [bacterium]|nr:bifunctional transaldolase/phosoglucose isomerase [bacterium]
MNNIQKTYELGQSIWVDFIRRSFITSGELGKLIDLGVTGITSNPTIFEKAITGSTDYDRSLAILMNEGCSSWEIYDELTREDIGMAADLFRPVYDRTEGHDGYVSLEVSPELAHDTEGTVREGMRLFTSLGRPNIMIKVPATAEGISAIEQLILKGVNVNVTLIFSLQQYRDAAQAYIVGLKKRSAEGRPIDSIASVASFFVSRVDTAVDQLLHNAGNANLKGRTAIANAKLAYTEFTEIFSEPDWDRLFLSGARLQRPLWASTSSKNPAYPDTVYVDALIGRHTVNTVPMETLQAFLDHGTSSAALSDAIDEAAVHMERLADTGISIEQITAELLKKGVKSFADSFDSLIEGIGKKAASLRSVRSAFSVNAAAYQDTVDKTLEGLREHQVIDRLWNHDHTLWKDVPREISNRLGWLNSYENMRAVSGQIKDAVEHVREAGYTDALLLGMGGSSLAPDLFRRTFGTLDGYLKLRVLDSTDPAAILDLIQNLDLSKTLFIVSTKSGTTTETLSLFKYFYNRTAQVVGPDRAGSHFIAITDPGSALQTLALELGFRETFANDPNIGGRYSALSYFGLVPAALMGLDINLLLDRAADMAGNCGPGNRPNNTGAILGGVMGALHNRGVDKLTFIASPSIGSLGAWLEQLLAESTGKEGKGIVPVDGELPGSPDVYGNDRLFVYLKISDDHTYDTMVSALEKDGQPVLRLNLADLYDIGSEFFRWEVATTVAGHIMGINPFDQPNVESAKVQSKRMLDEYRRAGRLPTLTPSLSEKGIDVYSDLPADTLGQSVEGFLAISRPGDYVALQAYVNPVPRTALALGEFRHAIRNKYHLATTVGFGPRFLHSTGQLHKGDSGNGLFIQITADDAQDLPIPDEAGKDASSITFGVLKAAQAMGDRQALLDAGRRVIRFHIKGDMVAGIRLLQEKMG